MRLRIEKQVVHYLPRNLHKIFPKLERLTINHCGMKNISREDLKGLENLEEIDLSNNELKSLPEDLFRDMKKLKSIYFDDNHIEAMSSNLLQPIKDTLEVAGFERNDKINDFYGKGFQCKNDLDQLMKTIDEKCPIVTFSTDSKDVPASPKYHMNDETADFTITAFGKDFKVHKCLLTAQSMVFEKQCRDETDLPFDGTECDESSFKAFLDFFYTGEVDTNVDIAKVVQLAVDLKVEKLIEICNASKSKSDSAMTKAGQAGMEATEANVRTNNLINPAGMASEMEVTEEHSMNWKLNKENFLSTTTAATNTGSLSSGVPKSDTEASSSYVQIKVVSTTFHAKMNPLEEESAFQASNESVKMDHSSIEEENTETHANYSPKKGEKEVSSETMEIKN